MIERYGSLAEIQAISKSKMTEDAAFPRPLILNRAFSRYLPQNNILFYHGLLCHDTAFMFIGAQRVDSRLTG